MKRKRKSRRKISKPERTTRAIVGPLQYDRAVGRYGDSAREAARLYAQKLKARKIKPPKGRRIKLQPITKRPGKVPPVHFQKVGKNYVKIVTDERGREKITRTTLKAIRRSEDRMKYEARINRLSVALGITKKDAREIDTAVVRNRLEAFAKFKKSKRYKSLSKAKKRRWTKKKTEKLARLGLDILAGYTT